MVRLLFLALVVLLALALWRWLVVRFAGERRRPVTSDLVRCTVCGAHVARHDAIATGSGWRCRDHLPEEN